MDMYGFETRQELPGQDSGLFALATAMAVISGVKLLAAMGMGAAKMAQSDDTRSSLGGPGTLAGGTAQSLYESFNRPIAQNPGLTSSPVVGSGAPDLDRIERDIGVIGRRLGTNRPAPSGPAVRV